MLRILLVDDHAVVREGLRSLIDAQEEMEVVGEAADGREALTLARQVQPDIAVVDISMPGMNGAQVAQQLKRDDPKVKILALTVHEDKGYLQLLLEAGASGYALKRAASYELVHAIRVVAMGGTYLDPFLTSKVIGRLVRKPVALEENEPLSDRETDVLQRLARGYSVKEIAAQLEIGGRTVETYKARSFEKLGIRSRTDLIRYAIQRGWLQDP